MDKVARGELLERVRLLHQAALDFPETPLILECHHLIDDTAALVKYAPAASTELARATHAAVLGQTTLVCNIVRNVLAHAPKD